MEKKKERVLYAYRVLAIIIFRSGGGIFLGRKTFERYTTAPHPRRASYNVRHQLRKEFPKGKIEIVDVRLERLVREPPPEG